METEREVGATVVLIVRVGMIVDMVTTSLEKEILTLKDEVSSGDDISVVGLGVIVVVGTGKRMSRSSIRELTGPAIE